MAEEQDNSSIQGSDLEENAKQWEKELTSESGEDELPTDEDNQLTQEESEEETEEDSDLEDDEADEEIEAEEEEPEEDLHEVKYDGKTHQVTLQQLNDSFSKGQNYTRKSQALADDRNSLEDSKAEFSQLREQALEALEYAKQNQPQSPERTDEYWNNLRDSDPVQFLIERDAVRDAQMQSRVVDQEIQRLNYQKEAEQQEHLNKHLNSEKEKLLDVIPEWSDSKLADAEKKLITKFGLKSGYSQEELDRTFDSRAVSIMRKGALWDQLQEKKQGIKPVRRESMTPGSKSGDPSKNKTGKAKEIMASIRTLADQYDPEKDGPIDEEE